MSHFKCAISRAKIPGVYVQLICSSSSFVRSTNIGWGADYLKHWAFVKFSANKTKCCSLRELNTIQRFLYWCYKRRYITELVNINVMLERQDKNIFETSKTKGTYDIARNRGHLECGMHSRPSPHVHSYYSNFIRNVDGYLIFT